MKRIKKRKKWTSPNGGAGNIFDLWHIGDFERVYRDIKENCECLFSG